MRKSLYLGVGGMNELDFQVAYNDIDLCLKAHEKGYINLCLSSVQAVHHEGVSRNKTPNKIKNQREQRERNAFYTTYLHLLKTFDPTFSRGFEMTAERGDPSVHLWQSPLVRRLLRGRVPFISSRFFLFQCADASLRLIFYKPSEDKVL
jgi:GT2 family glycosyltransferase